MFDTVQEAQQKLVGTIVAYDGAPFYIAEASTAESSVYLYGSLCEHDGNVSHPITDPKWGFCDLGDRLGYVNVDYRDYVQAVYVRRIPVRQSNHTQGLSTTNVRVTKLGPNKFLGLAGMAIGWSTLNKLPGFFETWRGKYPDMKTVRADMSKIGVTSRAIGRNLAVMRSSLGLFYLVYKNDTIGWTEDLERFRVPKQFRYLDELLIEDHNLKIQ